MTTAGLERKVRQFKSEPLRPGDPRLKPKGRLLIIGGHEDKSTDSPVLRTLADAVGSGKLVIATLASESPAEMFDAYETCFRGMGVRHLSHLVVESRADASTTRALRTLEDADAVFFTGGDQLRITSLIGDTPVFSRTYEIFVTGGTIAGSSAGAAIMSETMMVSGAGDESHRIREGLQLAPGLAFVKDMIIDQHFAERGRIGRLLAVVGQNPRILGVGIDENTAILVQPYRDFRVVGEGGVTVLDGRNVTYSNIAEADVGDTLSVFGVTLHALGNGDVFDLRHREPRDLPEANGSAHMPDGAATGRARTTGGTRKRAPGKRATASGKAREGGGRPRA
jgi:cyanophycinase